MIVPTRRFWILVAIGIGMALLGAWVPGVEKLVILYDLLLVIMLFASKYFAGDIKHLMVERRMDTVLSVRAKNSINLTLSNEGKVLLRGRFRDELPESFTVTDNEFEFEIPSGGQLEHGYVARPTERGELEMPGSFVRLLAPFGLCEIQYRLGNEEHIRVFPNVKRVAEFDLLNRRGRLSLMGVRRTRYRGLGTEFESMREYTEGDDYRRIDWKTTAKKGKFVVKDYELERNQAVILCIDLGRHMMATVGETTKLDHILDASLMLMHAAERAGDQIGLLVYAENVVRYVPPRRGRSQVVVLLDAIHNLRARPVESDIVSALAFLASRWKRRALVVMFTDVENPVHAEMLVKAIQPLRYRHLWFVTRVLDPRLDELSAQPIKSRRDFFQRAALSWYFKERNAARDIMSQLRIESIESEPEGLWQALVGAYVDAKQKAAI